MKGKDIELFEKLNAQLEGLYEEISILSKKSPNDAVNKFKLKFINQVLTDVSSIFAEKYRPFKDFQSFSEDDLPTNADVTFMLSQYINCMEKLRADNIRCDYESWYWVVSGQITSIQTAPPKKIKEK
jgi:hypothetical protein